MRLHLIIIISYILCLLPTCAAGQAGEPLRFVAADSLIFWDKDWNNIPQLALSADAAIRARAITTEAKDRKQLKELRRRWENDVEAQPDLAGGSLDRPASEQAYFAAETANAAGKLLLLTGDGHYMEAAERMLFNLLPALATDESDLPQRHVAAQTLMNLAGMMYATDNDGAYINFYTNCYVHMCIGNLNMSIDMITGMPHDARVKLRIGLPKGTHRLKLRLRLPEWATTQAQPANTTSAQPAQQAPMTIYVNGRDEELPVENGYIVIDRAWNSGDEVFFDFPFSPRFVASTESGGAEESRLAVVRGPLLYVPAEPTEGLSFPHDKSVTESEETGPFGHTILQTTLYAFGNAPQDAQASPHTVSLMPYADARIMKQAANPWIKAMP